MTEGKQGVWLEAAAELGDLSASLIRVEAELSVKLNDVFPALRDAIHNLACQRSDLLRWYARKEVLRNTNDTAAK